MSDPAEISRGASGDVWGQLRRATPARIGLGRVGDSLPTRATLEFAADHAAARDAVHHRVDVDALKADLTALGFADVAVLHSAAADRSQYLRRPDLGRTPRDLTALREKFASPPPDVAIVLADGLSPKAVSVHGPPLTAAILGVLTPALSVAPPVIALQARVALGDKVAAALGTATLIVLIGERPGLSVAESLGVYITHRGASASFADHITDAQRNCVSNVHPPDGLGYAAAARVVASLVLAARRLGRSGIDIKDRSDAELSAGLAPTTDPQ